MVGRGRRVLPSAKTLDTRAKRPEMRMMRITREGKKKERKKKERSVAREFKRKR